MIMNKAKILTLFILGIIIATPVHALVIDLFGQPVSTVDMVTLHSIWKDDNGQAYGWNQTNSTCSPIHFQIPYQQTYDKTYLKIGYVPLCDINQSDYSDHFITIFCNGDYKASYNYTDNCVDYGGAGVYEWEWYELNFENVTAGNFQTNSLTTTYSCMFCVNDTVNSPNRTDFWIRVENTGNMIVKEFHNETIIEGMETITGGLLTSVDFTIAIIELGYNVFNLFAFVWVILGIPMFILFMIRQLVDRFKSTFPKKRKNR